MRRADIEVPNPAVDVNSWAGSACYPRGSFYPVIHAPSTRGRRVTRPWFPICSARRPHSQAPLCPYTPERDTIRAEGTIGRLRYRLGGDRPSQTPHLPLSARLHGGREWQTTARVVFHGRLPGPRKGRFAGSHLGYADGSPPPRQVGVKLHGVFLSCHRTPESARALQFRRVLCRDSAQLVTPFVRVGTYPTRNFATLGRL
jgi:hypothetical protein